MVIEVVSNNLCNSHNIIMYYGCLLYLNTSMFQVLTMPLK
jgi:hypothetical protein